MGLHIYTCSFTGNPLSSDTVFYPLLTPRTSSGTERLGAAPSAMFEDVSGYGGFAQSGLNEVIYTATAVQDVVILGMERSRSRFIYSGNDLLPFQFFSINSEFGDTSPLAAVQLEQGVLSKGSYGFSMTTQTDSNREDVQIPNEVFEVRGLDNGQLRVCAIRDYRNEWIYFSYPSNVVKVKYPTRTLQYNYREKSWGLFTECFTCYGSFQKASGPTWATIGLHLSYLEPMEYSLDSGATTPQQPLVLAGTQHGFIVVKDSGSTGESPTLQIENISGTTVTCTAHCLSDGDFIVINSCLGTIANSVNGKPFQVLVKASTPNTFEIAADPIPTGTYLGSGTITKL